MYLLVEKEILRWPLLRNFLGYKQLNKNQLWLLWNSYFSFIREIKKEELYCPG